MRRLIVTAMGLAALGWRGGARADPAAGENTIIGKTPGGACPRSVVYLYP